VRRAEELMASPSFIHLRVHSAYSLSEGALLIKQMAALAKLNNMPAVAITDTGNLFGALEFSEAMKEKGIQPIVGTVLKVDFETSETTTRQFNQNAKQLEHLVLLAKDEQGYKNLMALVSASFLDIPSHEEPHVPLALLQSKADGLICLSGGPKGPVNRVLKNGQMPLAVTRLQTLINMFGNNLYVELQRHGLPEEQMIEEALVDLAYEYDVPLVATNDVHFADPEDFAAHDALICIADGEVIMAEERRRMTPDHCFKSQGDMAALFADLPEAISNTVEIARRCAFYVKGQKSILPRFADGDEAEELRQQARSGLDMRLASHACAAGFTREDYDKRLEFELGVIINMQYPGYFLIVADFIKWAKAQEIPVGPGRGSGAGSLVAYALTITDLDPMRFGLLFERFLNPDRVSMPDFDIDFCQERRDEVITYVQQRYGVDKVAQIITFGKLQARMVTRDVGRVLQLPYGQVDRLSKLIPMNPAKPVTLGQAIALEPRLQQAKEDDPQVAALFEIALKLEGLYRNASTHAAGIVIGDRPLQELVPLYRDPRSTVPATQFNMKYVEKAGLVKFDFLGLKTLTVIDKAQKMIRVREPAFDANKIPLDDEKTYKMLAQGDTIGVFQLESSGMRDAVRSMRADCIDDLIALVALYRPGPMANIPVYCARKLGKEPVEYLHPRLEPILKETFGVITYQEQVQHVAKDLAGYTLAEADLLRRAMGKKIQSEMDAQRTRFMEGTEKQGIDRDVAHAIFEACSKFAEYGFNKSHSAPYAYISYQTAYLKANHPVEFLAASMTLDMGNTDKLMQFRQEAQSLGVKVVPPSINESEVEFAVRDGCIFYALAALKNVGAGAMANIVAERNANGPFATLIDFASRVDPKQMNKRAMESLVKAGAFDRLNPNRAQVFASIEMLLALSNRAIAEASAGQNDFFGGSAKAGNNLLLPQAETWLPMDRLSHEFDAVGFYLSGHPLDDYAKALTRLRVEPWTSFQQRVATEGKAATKLAGTVSYKQERRSKQGNKFAFIGFSDATGQFEAVCFSDLLATARELLEPGKAVILRVDAEMEGETFKMRLQSVESLDQAASSIVQGLQIFLRDAAPLDSIRKRLDKRGRGPVRLTLLRPGEGDIDFDLDGSYAVTPQLRGAIKAIAGVVDVADL
jgi:DNA polymerase III subunit alpha